VIQIPTWFGALVLLVAPAAFAFGVAAGVWIAYRVQRGLSPVPQLPTLRRRRPAANAQPDKSPRVHPSLKERGVPMRIRA
jgi:hypothetical protein